MQNAIVDAMARTRLYRNSARTTPQPKDESREFIEEWATGLKLEEEVVSALIEAVKA